MIKAVADVTGFINIIKNKNIPNKYKYIFLKLPLKMIYYYTIKLGIIHQPKMHEQVIV